MSIFLEKSVQVVDKGKKSRIHTFDKNTCGTPQGYNGSPHFYTIASLMVAEMFKNTPGVKIFNFADDITLVINSKSFHATKLLAQKSLLEVEKMLRKIGVGVNFKKTELMVLYQSELSFNGHFPVDNIRSIPEKLTMKLLGLRFDSNLSFQPQTDFVLNDRFPRHRGLLNCVLLANSRIHLIGFINSTYYGNMQYAIEVIPNIKPKIGNAYAFSISQAISDVYGLPNKNEDNMRHSYRKLFSMSGLSSPIATQHKLIACFANRNISKTGHPDLKTRTLSVFRVRTLTGALIKYELMDHYSYQRLMSMNLIKLEVYKPIKTNNYYPYNLQIPFKHLPQSVKTELGTPGFNRLVKVFYKYSCPHRQGKNENKCPQCKEVYKIKQKTKTVIIDGLYKNKEYEFSLLQYMFYEGHLEWGDDFESYRKILSDRLFILIQAIIRGDILLQSPYARK